MSTAVGVTIADVLAADLTGNGLPDIVVADTNRNAIFWHENLSFTADLNGDGRVNGADVGILIGSWGVVPPGAPPAAARADINRDGVVDGIDLAFLLGSWSK